MRPLDTDTLDLAAKQYAAWYVADIAPFDRAFVMQEFYNFTFKDEFGYLVGKIRSHLGPDPAADFDLAVSALEPRSDEVFHALLEEKRPVGYAPKGSA